MSLVIAVDDALTLRLVEPHHADEVFALANANREHIAAWLPWIHITREAGDIRAWAERTLKAFAAREELAVTVLEHGKVVGGTGWTQWYTGDAFDGTLQKGSADIGYWLAADAQGRGIMTRCVAKLLDLAFDEYGMERITIRAEPGNERSAAVPRRLGFTLEGTMRHVFKYEGRWVDHLLFAMLADEWRARRKEVTP